VSAAESPSTSPEADVEDEAQSVAISTMSPDTEFTSTAEYEASSTALSTTSPQDSPPVVERSELPDSAEETSVATSTLPASYVSETSTFSSDTFEAKGSSAETLTITTSPGVSAVKRSAVQYIVAEKDTAECPSGFTSIDDVGGCVDAVASLGIQLSNSESSSREKLLNHVQVREITADKNDPKYQFGKDRPFGCFVHRNVEIVGGKVEEVVTVWLNHNKEQSGGHDSSALICQEKHGTQEKLVFEMIPEIDSNKDSDCFGREQGSLAELPDSGPYTIEAEIKPEELVEGSAGILGWGTYDDATESWNTLQLERQLDGALLLVSNWGHKTFSARLPAIVADGQYHGVGVTFDGSTMQFFLDHVHLQSHSTDGYHYSAVNANFCIGQTKLRGHDNFVGKIRNVRIFKGAKTYEVATCTEEAMLCPDGSSTSRDPTRGCEFYPCPSQASTPSVIAESLASSTELPASITELPLTSTEPPTPSTEAPTSSTVLKCKEDWRMCPDGSVVSHPSDSCVFSPCPTTSSTLAISTSTTRVRTTGSLTMPSAATLDELPAFELEMQVSEDKTTAFTHAAGGDLRLEAHTFCAEYVPEDKVPECTQHLVQYALQQLKAGDVTLLRSTRSTTPTTSPAAAVELTTKINTMPQEGIGDPGFWSWGNICAGGLAITAISYYCYTKHFSSNPYYVQKNFAAIEMRRNKGGSSASTLGRSYAPPSFPSDSL